MKNILLILLLSGSFLSCKKVLDLQPLDKISEGSVWSDPALVELYVNATYTATPHIFTPSFLASATDEAYDINNYSGLWIIQRGQLTSDNVTTVVSDYNYWARGYAALRNINIFFSRIDEVAMEDNLKNRLKGEMKFLRAFVYANLIWKYGGVPIIDKIFELNEDYSLARNSYDECVEYILSDIADAVAALPARQTGSALGRASADAALALKSRVLLYAASAQFNPTHDVTKWQRAADAAEALLDAGYSLGDDYRGIFLQQNNEIIHARYFSQANATDLTLLSARNGSNGWGGNGPTQNLVDDYEMVNGEKPLLEDGSVNPASGFDPTNPYLNRDPRFYATIIHDGDVWQGRETETYEGGFDSPQSSLQPWASSLTAYYVKKFMQEEIPPMGSTVRPTSPAIFFRYGEILLNYAEAKFELGDEETAREYLNKVRARPSVQQPEVTASGDELREKIRNERRIELAFEGHRFYDVRRWKIAEETEAKPIRAVLIKKEGSVKTYEYYPLIPRIFLPQHYLMPIPRTEVDKSKGSLEQNSGY